MYSPTKESPMNSVSSIALNFNDAQEFLDLFQPDGVFHFRLLQSGTAPKIFNGTFKTFASELAYWNRKGWNVYVMVNEATAGGQDDDSVICTRAQFIDKDAGAQPRTTHRPPHCIVETTPPGKVAEAPEGKRQYHWRTKPNTDFQAFRVGQARAIAYYQSDNRIKNLSRIMRLPGFLNWKNPASPHLVKLLMIDPTLPLYEQDELTAALPPVANETREVNSRQDKLGRTTANEEEVANQFQNSLLSKLITTDDALRAEAKVKKAFSMAVKKNQKASASVSIHGVILDAGLMATDYALIHGVPAAISFICYQAATAYSKLGRSETSARLRDDRRAAKDGLVHGLAARETQLLALKRSIAPTVSTNNRYVSEAMLKLKTESKIVGIQSGMDTGKTTYIRNRIADAKSVLIITYRRPLAYDWKKELGEKFALYSEFKQRKDLLKCKFVICSIDSLPKVRGMRFDVVVLDEADGAISHALLGETRVKDYRRKVLEVMQAVLYTTNQVFVCSAHLSELEMEVVKKLSRSDDAVAVQNLYVHPGEKYYRYVQQMKCENELIAKLKKGLSVIVHTDSVNSAESLRKKIIKQTEIEPLVLTAEHSDELADININDLVRGQQCVIASPVLGVGVNIDEPGLFDCVFGFFTNSVHPISYLDLMQSLKRVRKPNRKEYHVYISKLTNFDKLSKAEIEQRERVAETNVEEFTRLAMDNTLVIMEGFVELYRMIQPWQAQYLFRQYHESQHRFYKFWNAIKSEGHEVIDVAGDEEGVDDWKKEAKEINDEVKLERLQADSGDSLMLDVLGLSEADSDTVAMWQRRGKRIYELAKFSKLSEQAAKAIDINELSTIGFARDLTNAATKRDFAIKLFSFVDAFTNVSYSEEDLTEWNTFATTNADDLRSLGIKVDASKPAVSLNSVLKLMLCDVESTRVRAKKLTIADYRKLADENDVPEHTVKMFGDLRKAETWVKALASAGIQVELDAGDDRKVKHTAKRSDINERFWQQLTK